jgi:hypothetical protein
MKIPAHTRPAIHLLDPSPVRHQETTLVIGKREVGFFSNFNAVLNVLACSLGRNGAVAARVDWCVLRDQWEFPYGTADLGNIWDLLFEPLPFGFFPSHEVAARGFVETSMTGISAYALYKKGGAWRHAYNQVFRKFIRIRPHIVERAEQIRRQHLEGRPAIGVHVRNIAHSIESPFVAPPVAYFVDRTKRLLAASEDAAIFLATDTSEAVAAFERAFGNRLVIRKAERSERPGHNFHHHNSTPDIALAEQVLIDCLLLSFCDVMLHGTSNIATAAGYINPELKMVYCETPLEAFLGRLAIRKDGAHSLMRLRNMSLLLSKLGWWRPYPPGS